MSYVLLFQIEFVHDDVVLNLHGQISGELTEEKSHNHEGGEDGQQTPGARLVLIILMDFLVEIEFLQSLPNQKLMDTTSSPGGTGSVYTSCHQ